MDLLFEQKKTNKAIQQSTQKRALIKQRLLIRCWSLQLLWHPRNWGKHANEYASWFM